MSDNVQLKLLSEELMNLQNSATSNKDHYVHINNVFNKQMSLLMKEATYLSIIIDRIKNVDADKNPTQLNLDIKTLYIFGRVFSESILYTGSIFINDTKNINWEKIGPFIQSSEKFLSEQSNKFKDFWFNCENHIRRLNEVFKYRHDVLHGKESNTEWTMFWPGHNNLDVVSISNVPWKESVDKKQKQTLTPNRLISVLVEDTNFIIKYFKKSLTK